MSREDAIKVAGIVVEALPKNLFRVSLANGHRVMAHVSRKMTTQFAQLAPGDKVDLEMSPFDLSRGRIVLAEK